MVLRESIASKISFEWSHHGSLSTDIKIRTYVYDIITGLSEEVSLEWLHRRGLSRDAGSEHVIG